MANNSLKLWIKKAWIICFTDKPYRIKPFSGLFPKQITGPIDIEESTSGILAKQSGGVINYPLLPVSLNSPIIYRYINDKKRYLPTGTFKEPDRYIYSLQNGCLIGPLGLVYAPQERTFIAESAKEWVVDLENSAYTSLVNYPEKVKLGGITVSCLTNSADSGFYHFLFEAIVKLHYYNNTISHISHILFNGPPLNWKLKWLQHAGIDTGKIIWVDTLPHFECEQLIFTNRLINDQQIGNWCIKALKELMKAGPVIEIAPGDEKKVVWISRKGLAARDIEWEDEFLSRFPGIQNIDFAHLNAAETIELMQTATHVIAAHGAGLGNIYLCRPGTKILELYPTDKSFHPCYQRIATVCQLEHAVAYLDFKNPGHAETGINALSAILTAFIC